VELQQCVESEPTCLHTMCGIRANLSTIMHDSAMEDNASHDMHTCQTQGRLGGWVRPIDQQQQQRSHNHDMDDCDDDDDGTDDGDDDNEYDDDDDDDDDDTGDGTMTPPSVVATRS
jgi:hypothetical protein